jgi:hypothetical protein
MPRLSTPQKGASKKPQIILLSNPIDHPRDV